MKKINEDDFRLVDYQLDKYEKELDEEIKRDKKLKCQLKI